MDRKKMIGARLKTTRERMGLQQKEVAIKIGVHPSTLNKYESGEREPDAESLVKMADLYSVSLDYLAARTRKASPESEPSEEDPEQDFIRWVKENVSDRFFYDFDKDPEESKAQLMRDLKYMWERERKGKK